MGRMEKYQPKNTYKDFASDDKIGTERGVVASCQRSTSEPRKVLRIAVSLRFQAERCEYRYPNQKTNGIALAGRREVSRILYHGCGPA